MKYTHRKSFDEGASSGSWRCENPRHLNALVAELRRDLVIGVQVDVHADVVDGFAARTRRRFGPRAERDVVGHELTELHEHDVRVFAMTTATSNTKQGLIIELITTHIVSKADHVTKLIVHTVIRLTL